MKPSLADYLDLLIPYIPKSLVSDAYWARIKGISQQLPVLSLGFLECYLAPDEDRVDLNICINPRVNEHKTFIDWFTPQPDQPINPLATSTTQQQVLSFCTKWLDDTYPFKPFFGELLEVFDIEKLSGAWPTPWIYLSFLQTSLDSDPTIKATIIMQTLARFDNSLPDALKEPFFKHLCSIPPTIRISSVGIHLRNKQPTLRLFVMINTVDELILLLNQLKWPGNTTALRDRITPLVDGCHFLGVGLDFDESFLPRISIEYQFKEPGVQENLTKVSQYLVDHGLCSVAKQQALLSWNGSFETDTQFDFWSWPDRLIDNPEKTPKRTQIKRIIHYLKIAYVMDQPLEAKAYLGFLRPVMKV